MSNFCSIESSSKSDESSDTGAKPRHIKSGSMLGAADTIVELLTCNSWYVTLPWEFEVRKALLASRE